MVVSESAPYLKTGKLGDMIHSHSKAFIKLGHTVYVIMPKYAKLKRSLEGKVSVIDMLKYASQLSIDKDTAGAYVIGRKALGFKEDTPKNYEKLLKGKTYLESALKRYEEREDELKELIEKESNEYKRNALESKLRSVENEKELSAKFRARISYDMEFCNSERRWSEIVKRCMRRAFSWERSAREYEYTYTTAKVLRFYDS